MRRVEKMRHDSIKSQQGECNENADTCHHVGELFVWLVTIDDESCDQNNGRRQCNKENAPDLWQSFPGWEHAIAGPEISYRA